MSTLHDAKPHSARNRDPNHSTARSLAAIAGTFPVSIAVGIALAFALPFPFNERLLIGIYSVFPIWALAACVVFLSPNGRRAWSTLALITTIAILVVAISLGLGRNTSFASVCQ